MVGKRQLLQIFQIEGQREKVKGREEKGGEGRGGERGRDEKGGRKVRERRKQPKMRPDLSG